MYRVDFEIRNDCLSDLGNCGNYNQSAPDGLRAYYTMLSMANLNDMFRQMYEALEGQSSHSKYFNQRNAKFQNTDDVSEYPSALDFGTVSAESLEN